MINIIDHIKLLFRKDKELYSSLFRILGFYPHDITLYRQALSHSSSAMRGKNGKKMNNERLEFLGDAIIEAVTSDIVYHHFEQKREGFLTTTRSKLVQRSTLNKLAEEVGLDKLIRTNGHSTGHNNYIGGNAFEALVGAIYLDRGYKHCMWFLRSRIIAEHLNLDKMASKEMNFKSKLLEWTQKNRLEANFTFESTQQSKGEPATFHSEIVIEGIVCGKGDGYSKKESQQKAAKEALNRLRKEKKNLDTVLKAKEQRTAMEEEIISQPPSVENDETTHEKRNKPRRHSSMPKREPERARSESARKRDSKSNNDEKSGNVSEPRKEKQQQPRRAARKQTAREDVIAEAESKAFAQNGKDDPTENQ